QLSRAEFIEWVREFEAERSPRWVFRSAKEIYPHLLAAGVILVRSHDLLLCHAILRDTDTVARPVAPSTQWIPRAPEIELPALFDVGEHSEDDPVAELIAQYREQRRVIAA